MLRYVTLLDVTWDGLSDKKVNRLSDACRSEMSYYVWSDQSTVRICTFHYKSCGISSVSHERGVPRLFSVIRMYVHCTTASVRFDAVSISFAVLVMKTFTKWCWRIDRYSCNLQARSFHWPHVFVAYQLTSRTNLRKLFLVAKCSSCSRCTGE